MWYSEHRTRILSILYTVQTHIHHNAVLFQGSFIGHYYIDVFMRVVSWIKIEFPLQHFAVIVFSM